MQEQGKRLLTAVALALAVFLGYNYFFAKKPTPPVPGAGSGSAAISTVAEIGPRAKAGSEVFHPTTAPDLTAPAPVAAELTQHYAAFDVSFTNIGGAISGWRLSDKKYDKAKDADGKSKDEGQLIPHLEGAASMQLNYRRADGTALIDPKAAWVGTKIDDTHVKYELDTPDLHVTKTFTIFPNDYMVKLAISTSFKTALTGNAQVTPIVSTYAFQDPKTDDAGSARVQPRVWQSASLADGDVTMTAGIKIGTNGAADATPRKADHVQWTGFVHPFLMAVLVPQKSTADEDISKHTEAIDPSGLMRTDVLFLKQITVQKDTTDTRNVVGFFGPKNFDLLDHADAVAGFPTGLRDTIDFGHLPLLGLSLSLIGKPLLWLLGEFYGVVGNWGVAIILLTLMVKIITLFWTTRSMRSMKAMASLSPLMQEIQKKHGDDKAAAQQETMALYKANGVSPLAGCAPMFLQIPIWSALYIMLSATGELYQQAFIPGWVDDLTNSDPTHVLPVLLVVMMFLQARLTPQAANQPGQKMMQYGMPLMFGVMSFYFPAGLTLYIFTNTVLSSLHSIYMNKFDKKGLLIAEQLKKNKATVAAREEAAKLAAERAKAAPSGGNGKKKRSTNGSTGAGSIKALKETATTADEVADLASGTGTDGAALLDDDGDEPSEASVGAGTGSGSPRPRRKKRRR